MIRRDRFLIWLAGKILDLCTPPIRQKILQAIQNAGPEVPTVDSSSVLTFSPQDGGGGQ